MLVRLYGEIMHELKRVDYQPYRTDKPCSLTCRMKTSVDLPVWQHTFVSPSAFSRRAVVSYWRKYVHEVLVNRLGGLSLPKKSVVRLIDRPDMTLDVYRGRKTTMQQQCRPCLSRGILCQRFGYLGNVLKQTFKYMRYQRLIISCLIRCILLARILILLSC